MTENSAYTYQLSPCLSLKADGKGGYTFSSMAGLRGNGWAMVTNSPRYPTESELTDLGTHSPYTGSYPLFYVPNKVSGLPLANIFGKNTLTKWFESERNGVRSYSLTCEIHRYTGQTSLIIKPSTSNGTYYGALEVPGSIEHFGLFAAKIRIEFTRTTDYDEIALIGESTVGDVTKDNVYIIRLKKNAVSQEEPPISELVETTNITRGIGGNPKAFRLGDEVDFICEVKGEYA